LPCRKCEKQIRFLPFSANSSGVTAQNRYSAPKNAKNLRTGHFDFSFILHLKMKKLIVTHAIFCAKFIFCRINQDKNERY